MTKPHKVELLGGPCDGERVSIEDWPVEITRNHGAGVVRYLLNTTTNRYHIEKQQGEPK